MYWYIELDKAVGFDYVLKRTGSAAIMVGSGTSGDRLGGVGSERTFRRGCSMEVAAASLLEFWDFA